MTAPMTDAEIREALARAERATPGPWEITAGGGHKSPSIRCPESYHACGVNVVQADRSVISSVSYTNEVCEFPVQDVMGTPEAKAVAEFIAHARTDVPRLVATIREREAEIERLRGERDELRDSHESEKTALVHRAMYDQIKRERDEARAALATPTLSKHQPCGCVVCTCGDVERCGGCGARMCDRHRDDRPSLASDPATVWEAHPLLARAEAAEARCAALEAERAIVADYLRDTDADFRARRPSERAVLDALLSPTPPHTCQIHRATSGASDCGLEPCEEAKVHTDRGASRPATVRRVQATPVCPVHGAGVNVDDEGRCVRYVDRPEGQSAYCGQPTEATPFEADTAHKEAPHGPDCHGCGGAK